MNPSLSSTPSPDLSCVELYKEATLALRVARFSCLQAEEEEKLARAEELRAEVAALQQQLG